MKNNICNNFTDPCKCKDVQGNCSMLKLSGYCTKYPQKMRKICSGTCKKLVDSILYVCMFVYKIIMIFFKDICKSTLIILNMINNIQNVPNSVCESIKPEQDLASCK